MNATNKKSLRESVRRKYRDATVENIEVIPAVGEVDFYSDESDKRVAVYARVSTDDAAQTSSFELQQAHYEHLISLHPGWHLVKIYADEGISGTSLKNRDAFLQMIKDCDDGKIDLIVTKSVSRFARNVYDCIGIIRQLKALKTPVGIFFETEHLYTLNADSEMSLTFMATLAQEESHIKSNSMNLSYEMRFKRGIFMTPVLLGYDQDENGDLIINEDEATTVRLIFFMYMYGYTTTQIAETLMELGRKTKRGNTTWSSSTVLGILKNERHCGDVLARKTWTPNYLDHKSVKNLGNRNQYRKLDHHEPIISRNDFVAVQHMINNARKGYRGLTPSLHVINEGALKGFVIGNINWKAFDHQDYLDASNSVMQDGEIQEEKVHYTEPEDGEFDLRNFEVVRGQFFNSERESCVTLHYDRMIFTTKCIRNLKKTAYVELLLHPVQKCMVVRPSSKDQKNSLKWAKARGDDYYSRTVFCSTFLPVLFDLMGWEPEYRYRIKGVKKRHESGDIVLFNLREPGIIIPRIKMTDQNGAQNILQDTELLNKAYGKSIIAYPAEWADSFGSNFYEEHHPPELINLAKNADTDVRHEGIPFEREGEEQYEITTDDQLHEQINNLIGSMKQEANSNDE